VVSDLGRQTGLELVKSLLEGRQPAVGVAADTLDLMREYSIPGLVLALALRVINAKAQQRGVSE
jgi:hypothetical protein